MGTANAIKVLSITALFINTLAGAKPAADNKYFEVGSVQISTRDITMGEKEICTECLTTEYSIKDWERQKLLQEKRRESIREQFGMYSQEKDEFMLGQIVNFGQKLWKLIEAGKPVVNFEGQSANALPLGTEGKWQSLENWQEPRGRIYTITYKNLYKVEVVRFEYRLLFTPGGTYNGKGQYLSNVAVNPQNLSVAWGYDVAATSKVVNVVNTGSRTDPVAGIELLVDWRIKTVANNLRSTTSFFVRGDGKFTDLNGR